jgi:hypothetical protein
MFSERWTPRRRRWVRRIVLGLLVLLGLGGWGWWNLQRTAVEGKKELAAAIAETDKLDPRWHWEQIDADRPSMADAENSMRVIRELADSLGGWDPATLKLPDGEEFWSDEPAPANRQLDEDRLALLRKVLKERERNLALAVSLKDFSRGRAAINLEPDVLSTLLKHAQDCRAPIWLLQIDIERLLHEGRPQEAAVRIPAILNAVAGLRDDPFLVSHVVRMAGRSVAVKETERLLAMSELGDDELRQLMTAFKAEQGENLLLAGIRGERAGYHFLFENLESGRLPLADFLAQLAAGGTTRPQPDFSSRLGALVYESRLYEDHAFMLRRLNEAYAIAQLPTQEQLPAWGQWDQQLRTAKIESTETKRLILSSLLISAIPRVRDAAIRDQAQLSCTLAVLAAERFRLAHKRWPKNLQELCPKYLVEVPIDPFDGKPLRLAHKKDGIAIYSVGKDGQDDGGEILNPSMNDGEMADLGLRLWHPSQRRLPAEPRKKDEEKGPDDEE